MRRIGEGVTELSGLQSRGARPARAEHVDHRRGGQGRRRTEREAADRADVLFELRCGGTFDRPVAAVVDTRSELVDHELAVRHQEQLGRERPGHAHRDGQPLPEVSGTVGDLGGDRRGRHGFRQDPRVVGVPRQRERRRSAVDAAGHDDRHLHVEGHLGLGQEGVAGRAAEPLERPIEVRGGVHADLAPAVVPPGRGLDPQRQPEFLGRLTQVVRRLDLAPGRDHCTCLLDEAPLGDAILGHEQRQPTRSNRHHAVQGIHDGDRYVLELVRHDVARCGQTQSAADVVVAGHDLAVGEGGRGAVGVGIHDGDPVAHRPRGEGQHPAQLAASEDADRRRRGDRWQAHDPSVDCRPCDRSSAGASRTWTSANSPV